MPQGQVIKTTGNLHLVKCGDEIFECNIKGNFRIKGIKTTNPVAVGDIVDFLDDTEKSVRLITKIHERKNYIIRKSINLSRQAHIIAANIDQAFLMVTLILPETSTVFMDRFLASAEAYRIPVVIVFNKIDLYNESLLSEMNELIAIYTKIGYPCISISAERKINIDALNDLMKDKTSVIAGNSGVGKSTIINTIAPDLKLKTGELSDHHLSGKHTTTFSELFSLPNGGAIIDTPGLRAFGVVDFDKNEIYHFFPELFAFAKDCQFYNCKHITEPRCAVKSAVKSGEISASRYNSYLSIFYDDDEKYRKESY